MERTSIGELEELCLLSVGILGAESYGLTIKKEIESRSERSITISTIHSTMIRLEKKGFLESKLGGATESRGGRTKRLFSLTALGKRAIAEAHELRNGMWHAIPSMTLRGI